MSSRIAIARFDKPLRNSCRIFGNCSAAVGGRPWGRPSFRACAIPALARSGRYRPAGTRPGPTPPPSDRTGHHAGMLNVIHP
jgi:hypothetical protein